MIIGKSHASHVHSRTYRTAIITILCISLFAGVLAITACSPQNHNASDANSSSDKNATTEQTVENTDQSADQATTDTDSFSTVNAVNFTDTNTGLFPDTYTNRVLNTGNRGCNSCHVDLWQTVSQVEATEAEANSSAGGHICAEDWNHYGRKGTVLDCIGCHSGRVQNTGPYFGDSIHTIHYQNQDFLNNEGNCWSCHAVHTDEVFTDTNDYDLLLGNSLCTNRP